MLPDIHLKHKCDNINKLVITLAFVGEKMIGGWKLYGLMNSLKWINASKYKAATARIPPILTYREKERESLDTQKRKTHLCLSLIIYPYMQNLDIRTSDHYDF